MTHKQCNRITCAYNMDDLCFRPDGCHYKNKQEPSSMQEIGTVNRVAEPDNDTDLQEKE